MSEKIDFVQKIVTWIEEKQIFSRERKINEQSSLMGNINRISSRAALEILGLWQPTS